jgi:hypothetical protein
LLLRTYHPCRIRTDWLAPCRAWLTLTAGCRLAEHWRAGMHAAVTCACMLCCCCAAAAAAAAAGCCCCWWRINASKCVRALVPGISACPPPSPYRQWRQRHMQSRGGKNTATPPQSQHAWGQKGHRRRVIHRRRLTAHRGPFLIAPMQSTTEQQPSRRGEGERAGCWLAGSCCVLTIHSFIHSCLAAAPSAPTRVTCAHLNGTPSEVCCTMPSVLHCCCCCCLLPLHSILLLLLLLLPLGNCTSSGIGSVRYACRGPRLQLPHLPVPPSLPSPPPTHCSVAHLPQGCGSKLPDHAFHLVTRR